MSRIEVRRAADRFRTVAQGRSTWHSFSFDRHYDPGNVGLGVLVCHNDDRVESGHGYPSHPHREVEVVTWVLEGALAHRDSTGHAGLVVPGQVQRLSAGTGVVHSEFAPEGAVHFLQMWVTPDVDRTGLPPAYDQAQADLGSGHWVTLASGLQRYADAAAVSLRSSRAALHVARVLPAGGLELPDAPGLHVFLARGRVEVEEFGALATGDAVRVFDGGGQRITAFEEAELVVWELH